MVPSPETEHLLRLMGVTTGSCFMWLTDDGGIGGPHYKPQVQCYQTNRACTEWRPQWRHVRESRVNNNLVNMCSSE